MPFADGSGVITFLLEHIGHCDTSCINNQFGITRCNACVLLPPGIHTCKQSEAGRGTCGRGGICIGELHTLTGKAVYIRGTYFSGTVAAEVADAQVVSDQVITLGFCGWSLLASCLDGLPHPIKRTVLGRYGRRLDKYFIAFGL